MVLGVCGACRCDEMCNLRVGDVKDYGDEIVVRIPYSKTKTAKSFPINGVMAEIVRKYVLLRSTRTLTDRFLVSYRCGKCTVQVMGKNTVAKIPCFTYG